MDRILIEDLSIESKVREMFGEEDYYTEIESTIFLSGGIEEDRKEIGRVLSCLIDVELIVNQEKNVHTELDSITQETADLIPLVDENGRPKKRSLEEAYICMNKILYLRRITIYHPYRGKGIGEVVTKRIINRFGRNEFVLIKPYPIQTQEGHTDEEKTLMRYDLIEQDKKVSLSKLKRIYKSWGFEPLGRTGYMYFDQLVFDEGTY